MSAPITVLMAVHNGEPFLERSIASVLRQSRSDFQFVIVDDASDDGSSRVLAAAAQADSRIQVIRNARNLGLTESLNVGLRAARGDLIARIDADDFAAPRRLEIQAEFLHAKPGYVLVGGRERIVDSTGRELRLGRRGLSALPFHYLSYFAPPIVHSAAMFRRTVDGEPVEYDEGCRTAQDFELWQRLLRHGKGLRLPDVVVDLSVHDASVSSRRNSEQADTAVAASTTALARDFPEVDPDGLAQLAAFALAGRMAAGTKLAGIIGTALAVEGSFLARASAGPRERREIRALTVNRLLKGAARGGSTKTLAALALLLFRRPMMVADEVIAIGGRRAW